MVKPANQTYNDLTEDELASSVEWDIVDENDKIVVARLFTELDMKSTKKQLDDATLEVVRNYEETL